MMLKKALAGITVTMLLVSMLASCGDEATDDSGSSGNETSTSTSTTSTADGEKVNGVMYPDGLPIVDPGSYTFSLFCDATPDVDYVMFPILEEQTGVTVDPWFYSYDVATERLSLMLNSGDYADCIGGWLLSANDILVHGMDEQMYIPLEGYFEDYCPRIQEILEVEGVRDTMTCPDGHIYSIPYALEAPAVPYNLFVNTDWLERLNIEMPTTTEEFRDMLRKFKEEDANSNGDPNDEYPMVLNNGVNIHIGDLCGWFGMSINDEGFTMVDGELTFGANTEEYKNGISFLRDLYAEGLIDPESFTQDGNMKDAKYQQDLYGVGMLYGGGDVQKDVKVGEKPHWDPLPVLSSPECSDPVYLRDTYGTDVLKNQVVITDNAENPEVICRWWDNFFELDNVLQSQYGPLDVTLFKEEDGYHQIDMSTLSEEDQEKYNWGNLFPQCLPKYVPRGFTIVQDPVPYNEKAVVDELYEPYLTEAIPDYWVSAEDATRMADLSTAIKTYLMQKQAEWISGQADIDAEWEDYKAQLEKLGLQELIELRKNALN